jgi:hypothetical protein
VFGFADVSGEFGEFFGGGTVVGFFKNDLMGVVLGDGVGVVEGDSVGVGGGDSVGVGAGKGSEWGVVSVRRVRVVVVAVEEIFDLHFDVVAACVTGSLH